jgi:murein DD-endopeptidase MepM/ murein hydrolase activator NlpD
MLKRISIVLGVLALLVFGVIFFSGKETGIKLAKPAPAIGAATTISVEADGPAGVKAFSAAVEQEESSQLVYEDDTASSQPSRIYTFTAGRKLAPFLKEGPAKLVLKAKSNDLRGATKTVTFDIQVVLRPPTIVADGLQHYINQGGAELVTIDVGGNWSEAGVQVANYAVGSFPMPGEPDNSSHRFALFPFSWDVSPETIPLAFALNGAGTEVTTPFTVKLFPKRFRTSDILVSDENLRKVVNDLDPDGTGSLPDRFVKLNRELRRANTQQIYELRTQTEKRILWSGPFIPVKGTRESFFADRRSYIYKGRKIDEQVHLGYDLAQTAHTPVRAANAGKVIYAARLGIYGNCVILDHGYSLESLYGHMSQILVKVGDTVTKQQQIGISGSTGMAFGDHVHFSMLVGGYQVDPKEWWDEHWIHDRILSKIGGRPRK